MAMADAVGRCHRAEAIRATVACISDQRTYNLGFRENDPPRQRTGTENFDAKGMS